MTFCFHGVSTNNKLLGVAGASKNSGFPNNKPGFNQKIPDLLAICGDSSHYLSTQKRCWTYWCLVGNGWEWGNGMIMSSDYRSFPHSLLSTSKNMWHGKPKFHQQPVCHLVFMSVGLWFTSLGRDEKVWPFRYLEIFRFVERGWELKWPNRAKLWCLDA